VRLPLRKTHGLDTEGQHYHLYATPEETYACPFTAISRWSAFYLNIINKDEYGPDEYLASRSTVPEGRPSKGKVHRGSQMTDTDFQALLDIVVDECKLMEGRTGNYTTRCCRRGGGMI
jgi:hypothetical protein